MIQEIINFTKNLDEDFKNLGVNYLTAHDHY